MFASILFVWYMYIWYLTSSANDFSGGYCKKHHLNAQTHFIRSNYRVIALCNMYLVTNWLQQCMGHCLAPVRREKRLKMWMYKIKSTNKTYLKSGACICDNTWNNREFARCYNNCQLVFQRCYKTNTNFSNLIGYNYHKPFETRRSKIVNWAVTVLLWVLIVCNIQWF